VMFHEGGVEQEAGGEDPSQHMTVRPAGVCERVRCCVCA